MKLCGEYLPSLLPSLDPDLEDSCKGNALLLSTFSGDSASSRENVGDKLVLASCMTLISAVKAWSVPSIGDLCLCGINMEGVSVSPLSPLLTPAGTGGARGVESVCECGVWSRCLGGNISTGDSSDMRGGFVLLASAWVHFSVSSSWCLSSTW